MTDKIFSAVFKSLCQYYRLAEHERPDNNARIEYYKAVRFVDDSDARSLYSALVNAFKFFPKIPEVREVSEQYRPKLGAFTNDNFCYCCLNVGHITYIRTEEGYPYEYLARCPCCEAGKNYPELPAADLKFQPEELEALIGKNRERYGKLDHTQPEQAKKVVLQFLRSF